MRNGDLPDGGRLVERLERFAAIAEDDSPLYGRLARACASDPTALAILAEAPSRLPPANILLAAVHYLLMGGSGPELARHYPTVTGGGQRPTGDPVDLFLRFCADHRDRIVELVTSRGVQTNEVRRCATLLPGFTRVVAENPGPLALVEVGPSAGLNLLFDRYRYDYGPAGTVGAPDAPLTLTCEVLEGSPPIPRVFPAVAGRCGVDLDPVDLGDPDTVRWTRALVWPEQLDRLQRLDTAIAVARDDPPDIRSGDAVDLLSSLLEEAPGDAIPVVYHSYVLNQFTEEARDRFDAALRRASANRPIHRLSLEMIDSTDGWPLLTHTQYHGGEAADRQLGTAHFHGTWIKWN